MHNRALHDSLAAFVEEAARQLADEVSGGAEVPFELMEMSPQSRATSPLYCYRPLTGHFIGERIGVLVRLPSYPAAAQGLAALPDLPAYLQARHIAVEVDPVHALDVQPDMTLEQIARGQHAHPHSVAPARRPTPPQTRRSEAKPHWWTVFEVV